MTASDESPTLDEVTAEGERLARAARSSGVTLLALGGVAVWLRCPSARVAPLARRYGDVDFVGHGRQRAEIVSFMENNGYAADKMFNALHGDSRLNFMDPLRHRPVDVLIDRFSMAHELDLRERLDENCLTLPLADLLLTKLQVVSLNAKDLNDIVAILLDHGFDSGGIDLQRILDVTSSDWGFEHTIHGTIRQVRERIAATGLQADAESTVRARVGELEVALDAAPKGRRWRMRARIGERVRWYEDPEEARS